MIDNRETIEAKKQAQHFGLGFISLKGVNIQPEVLNIIPEDVARKNSLVVYKKNKDHLSIAVANPELLTKKAPEVLTRLKKEGNITFALAITTQSDLDYALLGYKQKYQKTEDRHQISDIRRQKMEQNSSSQVKIINLKALGKIPYEILTKFPESVARKYKLIVFAESPDGQTIKVAVVDPDNLQTQEILDFIGKRNEIKIEQYQTSEQDIYWALKFYQNQPQIQTKKSEFGTPKVSEVRSPIVSAPKINIEQPIPKNPLPEKKIRQRSVILKSPIAIIKTNNADSKNIVSVSEEEENLDTMLPAGVRDTNDLVNLIKSGNVPKIIAGIIYLAVGLSASDIHLEGEKDDLKLRLRLDGVLKDIVKMPLTLQAPIISRIKILARMKIDEQRIPQDGRFNVKVAEKEIDLRVSTLPTVHGEKVVMRILDKTTGIISLDQLGLIGNNSAYLEKAISKPYGIILVTGPTGSGKTTTLYAVLKKISTPELNIITLEDPVEYELPGINQCQIKPKIGFGFAQGVRSILRQDPNIVMVGEIRDTETANMATHAALTGHLVLSTLHTNDAAGALPRLIDMGVEPYLITSSINAIVAQRLVRKLCEKCKAKTDLPTQLASQIKEELEAAYDAEIKKLASGKMEFYKPKGCSECKDGYKGRIGLFEVLTMNSRIEQLAVSRATASVIKRAALNSGMTTIRQDGFAKAVKGMTSADEIIRVTAR